MQIIEPNALCREYGLKDVKELAEITESNERTLYNWSKNKQVLFRVAIMGAVELRKQQKKGAKGSKNQFK